MICFRNATNEEEYKYKRIEDSIKIFIFLFSDFSIVLFCFSSNKSEILLLSLNRICKCKKKIFKLKILNSKLKPNRFR